MLLVFQWILEILVIIVSILGIILVLMQSSKGAGGLFGNSDSQNNIIGSARKGDFLSRTTSIFIAIFIVGNALLAYINYKKNAGPTKSYKNLDKLEEKLKENELIKKEAKNNSIKKPKEKKEISKSIKNQVENIKENKKSNSK